MEDLIKFLASLFGIELNPQSKPKKPLSGMNKMSGGDEPPIIYPPTEGGGSTTEKKQEKKKKDTW